MVQGCYFHFKQSMWRKIQEVCLSVEYVKNTNVYKKLVMPQCLAYLPPEDVRDGFFLIKESFDISDAKLKIFFDYFQNNYVVKEKEKRGRFNKKIIVYEDPLFDISLWNVNSRINENFPRTNNCCESWHNSFAGILNKHPLVYELINAMRHEQNRMETNLLKIRTGKLQKKTSKSDIENVQKILSNYNKNNLLETLNLLSLL